MSDLHPVMQESLTQAVIYLLAKRGEHPTPWEIERTVNHLLKGLVEGAERAGADWDMTWGHLIQYFCTQGASLYEAHELALTHFAGILIRVCREVTEGCWGDRVDTLEKLEVCIRYSVETAMETELLEVD